MTNNDLITKMTAGRCAKLCLQAEAAKAAESFGEAYYGLALIIKLLYHLSHYNRFKSRIR